MTAGKLVSQPGMVQPMPLDQTGIQTLTSQMTERESWSREHLLEYQQQSLDRVLQHAVKKSPYYRRVLGEAIREGARFHELPILTKSQLMDCFDDVTTQPHLRLDEVERHLASDEAAKPLLGQYYAVASGGTTGERGVIVYDRAAWEVMVAMFCAG